MVKFPVWLLFRVAGKNRLRKATKKMLLKMMRKGLFHFEIIIIIIIITL